MSKTDDVPLDLIHRTAKIWSEPQHAHKIMDDELGASIVKALLEERNKSAAPDLLEALKLVMMWISNWDPNFSDDDEWTDEALPLIKAAISKAEGQ